MLPCSAKPCSAWLRSDHRRANVHRWAAGEWGLSLHLTLIQALVYGSLISTTDTVRAPGACILAAPLACCVLSCSSSKLGRVSESALSACS